MLLTGVYTGHILSPEPRKKEGTRIEGHAVVFKSLTASNLTRRYKNAMPDTRRDVQ